MIARRLCEATLSVLLMFWLAFKAVAQAIPDSSAINAEVKKIMSSTHANGIAVAVVDHGKVGFVQAYGIP